MAHRACRQPLLESQFLELESQPGFLNADGREQHEAFNILRLRPVQQRGIGIEVDGARILCCTSAAGEAGHDGVTAQDLRLPAFASQIVEPQCLQPRVLKRKLR